MGRFPWSPWDSHQSCRALYGDDRRPAATLITAPHSLSRQVFHPCTTETRQKRKLPSVVQYVPAVGVGRLLPEGAVLMFVLRYSPLLLTHTSLHPYTPPYPTPTSPQHTHLSSSSSTPLLTELFALNRRQVAGGCHYCRWSGVW